MEDPGHLLRRYGLDSIAEVDVVIDEGDILRLQFDQGPDWPPVTMSIQRAQRLARELHAAGLGFMTWAVEDALDHALPPERRQREEPAETPERSV
jgi:anti-sigma regulatory factor (Ser/Thr protein kinase)